MHPGGFEPPTARFVAEYSIQLSYGCIGKAILLRGYSPGTYDGFAKPDNNNVAVTKENMVHPGGLLGCASPYGPLLTQRYPPWCWR